MKKQLAIAVGVLFTLGTAVSASLNDDSTADEAGDDRRIRSRPQLDSKQSAQIVALWNTHADFVWLGSAGASALS